MRSSYASSPRLIVLSWVSLLVLTLLTSLIGLVNFGSINLAVSLAIAAMQASVIVFGLMHALHGPSLLRVVLAGGVIWFLILETLTWADYLTRGWLLPSGK